ncbi:MAG: cyclase family protein [Armatimonadetes bacterium]|nr:cyclase family protein [Armatimonadota bacterium]
MTKESRGPVCDLGPRDVLRAVSLVKKGTVYDLEAVRWNLMPTWSGHPPFQVITYRTPHGIRTAGDHVGFLGRNDPGMGWFSELILGSAHTGTHIDALGHITSGKDSCWFGNMNEAEDSGDFGLMGGDVCSIPPVITRGVMIDVPAYHGRTPLPRNYPITVADVEGALASQGVRLEPNDVVLVRTGYMGIWPDASCTDFHGAGITLEVARYFCDSGAVVVGADTESLEVVPSVVDGNPHPVHIELLNNRGVHIMEMMYLEELARDRVYEFLFMTSPLKIRGATGSMIRPLAVV